MKRLKEAFARWKTKHWDEKAYIHDEPMFLMMGFERPPLRAFWEKHKVSILKAAPWLASLIGGAIILKIVGLG
ncbi:hypothetical protein WHX55_10945 [Pseudomonas fluorescens]|uniref:hypothetical protein n=1 Tax=Pseudomonas fluorescens TaxID=294 RepID=UPI003247667F